MPMKGADGPSEEELKEIEDLKALIHGAPQRESSIPLGAVSRFLVGEDNRSRADQARKEKEERDALKAELLAQRAAHAAKLKQDAIERRKREKEEKEAMTKKRQEEGRQMREKGAEWKAEAAKRLQREWELGQKRVQEENERFKNMDKAEADQDKKERAEGRAMDKANEEAFKKEKLEILEANRRKVQEVKRQTDPALLQASKQWASESRTGGAANLRRQKEELKVAAQEVRQSHVDKALAIKGQVNTMKENAKAVHKQMLDGKAKHAQKERNNDYLVEQEKLRVAASKKKQHQDVYAKKYAKQDLAQSWAGASTLRRGAKLRTDVASPEG